MLCRRIHLTPEDHRAVVHLNGIRVQYRVAGSGKPVVLLHGLGGSARDWDWVIPDLAHRHRVYIPDLPGTGGSDRPRVDYTPEFLHNCLKAFLDALDLEQVALVGNSIGGLACLHEALRAPDRITDLVLVDSAGLGKETSPLLLALSWPGLGDVSVGWSRTPVGAWQRVIGRTALLFARPWRAPTAWLMHQWRLATTPGFLEATLSALRSHSDGRGQSEVLLDRLGEVRPPTLIVWGIEDRLLPPEQAHRALRRLARGSLKLLPACGHLPQLEEPRRFISAVEPFLSVAR